MQLTHFDAAKRELALAKDIDEVMQIRDKAAALAAYLRQQKESRQMQNDMAEIKLRAERKAGELLIDGQERGEIAEQSTGRPKKSDIMSDISPRPLSDFDLSHKQASRLRQIAAIDEPTFEQYIAEQKESEHGEVTTAGALRLAAGKRESHQLINQSENNEWYTPAPYVDAARAVMGGIDLDPASNEYANRTVQAKRIFTIDDDGYKRPWFGRVWLNPPYGFRESNESNQAAWSRKLIAEYHEGNVSEAVLLVNAVPGNRWFAPLWDFPICFPDHRIRFYNQDTEAGQPTHSNALVYLGLRFQQFATVFGRFGVVAVRYDF